MNRERVEQLYAEYGGMLFRRCLRILGNPEEAECAVQEVFVRVIRRLTREEKVNKARNYMFRAATNYCLNKLRDKGRLPGFVAFEHAGVAGGRSPEQNTADRLLLERCLADLKGTQRLVVYLHLVEGFTQEEVAKTVELSRQTVSKMIRRFRQRARILAEEGRAEQ